MMIAANRRASGAPERSPSTVTRAFAPSTRSIKVIRARTLRDGQPSFNGEPDQPNGEPCPDRPNDEPDQPNGEPCPDQPNGEPDQPNDQANDQAGRQPHCSVRRNKPIVLASRNGSHPGGE